MAIYSYTVQQVSRYTPVADELKAVLKNIQNDWGYKVISVYETTVNKTPNCSSQAFIIIYDDTQKDVQPVRRGRWELTNNPSFRKCSECGKWHDRDVTNFCPHCGADMRDCKAIKG